MKLIQTRTPLIYRMVSNWNIFLVSFWFFPAIVLPVLSGRINPVKYGFPQFFLFSNTYPHLFTFKISLKQLFVLFQPDYDFFCTLYMKSVALTYYDKQQCESLYQSDQIMFHFATEEKITVIGLTHNTYHRCKNSSAYITSIIRATSISI